MDLRKRKTEAIKQRDAIMEENKEKTAAANHHTVADFLFI